MSSLFAENFVDVDSSRRYGGSCPWWAGRWQPLVLEGGLGAEKRSGSHDACMAQMLSGCSRQLREAYAHDYYRQVRN